MKIDDYLPKGTAHAPINPATGMPNGAAGSAAADGAAAGPDTAAGSGAGVGSGAVGSGAAAATATGDGAGSGPTAAPGSSPGSTSAPGSAPASGSSSASAARASAPGAASSAAGGPEADAVTAVPVEDDAAPSVLFAAQDAFLAKLLRIVDNRIVSMVVLALLLYAIAGFSYPLVMVAVLFAGYLFIDRFEAVRHAVSLGGCSWAAILFLGDFIEQNVGRVFFSMDYLFMFCGFLLAFAVCGIYFVGRASFEYGYDRGQAHADHAIAGHIVERLIENPDDVQALDGDFLEVEAAISRVRERERTTEQAFKDESRRKDDLVTYLAHDLKTPLASVVGYLSLLEEAPDLPEEQRTRFTGVALKKAHRLDALIEEFFDITRFDFHDIVLTRGYIDLALMLAQVVDEFYPALTEQGKSVQIDVSEPITVLVDGDKMARVFNNVMKNAIAYSYEGSTIRVLAQRDADWVVIRFENEGDPIPAAKLNVIFEKFYRLDASRATNRGGAGLGLAIAKEIVCAHGGTISCASSPELTVFTIKLPA